MRGELSELCTTMSTIEQQRERPLIVLAASRLDMEILPSLYQQLLAIGKVDRLDVLLQSQGGVVHAARRIVLLLRQFAKHLCIIAPYHCASSATLLALGADEIIAGDLAQFSPIDPRLEGGSEAGADTTSLSSMDIKAFGSMCSDWFGVDGEAARGEALALLCNSIFPPTLTAFYRSTQEMQAVAEELLAYQLPQLQAAARREIVQHLMYGYHSHNYAITREELMALGLQVRRLPTVEALAWEASCLLQGHVGGAARSETDAPWTDVLLAGAHGLQLRQHRADGLAQQWTHQAWPA